MRNVHVEKHAIRGLANSLCSLLHRPTRKVNGRPIPRHAPQSFPTPDEYTQCTHLLLHLRSKMLLSYSLSTEVSSSWNFCQNDVSTPLTYEAIHLYDDAAVICNQWESFACGADSFLSGLGPTSVPTEKSNLRVKDECYGTFPQMWLSHHTQTCCWLTATNSAVTMAFLEDCKQRCAGLDDGTLHFLCGHHKRFNHRYFKLSEVAIWWAIAKPE